MLEHPASPPCKTVGMTTKTVWPLVLVGEVRSGVESALTVLITSRRRIWVAPSSGTDDRS